MTTPLKNAVNWFAIAVTDLERSATLYGAMLDRTLKREEVLGIPHAIIPTEAPAVGGTLVHDPRRQPGGNATLVYLNAPDGVARCLARAVEAGATVMVPLTRTPFGEIAVIADFDGNHVGLHART